jgi:hypothetical protein
VLRSREPQAQSVHTRREPTVLALTKNTNTLQHRSDGAELTEVTLSPTG